MFKIFYIFKTFILYKLLLLLLYQFSYYKLKEKNFSWKKLKSVSYITTNKYNKFNTIK